MAITISSNAQLIGNLFTSMSSTKNSYSSSLFSSTDLLGINYMDYSSIKSGSYYKLLNAYYSLDNDEETKSGTVTEKKDYTIATSTDSASKLADIESKAESLNETASTLLTVGTKSLFQQTDITDEEGNTTKGYDTDKIYQAVKTFASQYNSLVDSAESSKVSRIASAASSIVSYTERNAKLLSSVGITIDEETKDMKVDEETFKKADMSTVKSLFNGTGSYAYQVSVKASMIDYYAQNEASKANTYNGVGSYSYNYSSGSIWDSFIQ